jgi:hypothetical protein
MRHIPAIYFLAAVGILSGIYKEMSLALYMKDGI